MSDEGREHAHALLKRARNDARAVAGMTDPKVFADEIFGCHAQQATEKALKAWCGHRGLMCPLTYVAHTNYEESPSPARSTIFS